jgi:2-polyprenyl-6-hydroxyphenyl methylase/3-demethylubiquinone-9 3-methyltransferase
MNDLGLYDRHADDWWNQQSRFSASLHELNRVRRLEILHHCAGFRGLAVDLGCGGGLMAEPLAAGGATVLGFDMSAASLTVARAHGQALCSLAYARADISRVPLTAQCADLVLMADVLEHIESWRAVVHESARLAKSGALIYVNTINRTWRARLFAIHLVETLRLVPPGTHSYRLLITPDELAATAREAGLEVVGLSGYAPRFWRSLWTWRLQLRSSTHSHWACYAMWLRKP